MTQRSSPNNPEPPHQSALPAMDLYIQGLPPDLSKATLQTGLQPYMNTLGIEAWSCNDPFKKDFAFISFLRIEDANAFLRRHGAARPWAPRLNLFGSPIYVSKARGKLDKLTLQHLAYEHDQRRANARPLSAISTVLPLREISCGHLMFLQQVQDAPTFMRQCSKICDIHATAKFAKKTLILKYEEVYRVDIPYSSIWDMVVDPRAPVATLILTEVPRFYTSSLQAHGVVSLGDSDSRGPKMYRIDHLGGYPEHANFVADCLVYQLTFQTSSANFHQTMEAVYNQNHLPYSKWSINVDFASGAADFPTSLRLLTDYMSELAKTSKLPFGILFQVNALVRNNYIEPNVARDILGILVMEFDAAKLSGSPPPFSAHSFKPLFGDIPYPVPGIDPVRLTAPDIMNKLVECERQERARAPFLRRLEQERSARQSWVFKAVVTPTRITFHGPDLETNNRILRKFSDFTEYFLRVQFCEEDGEDLYFNPTVSHDVVLERFKRIFNQGIEVGGRLYGFLGFSHSSLRSHSAWFSAAFVDHDRTLQNYITIIRDLGDFKNIRIPARCAARIGQAFSETPFSVDLKEHGIRHGYMADVKSPDGKRTFSDGVGTISLQAAEVLWKELPKSSNMATCFQIRWAGAKGMLSLDTRIPGRLFVIRDETMVKFEGGDESQLEICDMSSRPMRMVLNQQMIKIMEDLGVSEEWFFRQQKRELDILKAVTRSIENTSAFLHVQDVGTAIDLPKFFKRLQRRKIDYRTDVFLRSLVEAVVLRELRLIKHKARIPVKKGATLFGVMDETGFLEEDEVYVTYDKTYRGARGVVDGTLQDGPVMITRSPALHPGDIQFRKQRTPPAKHPLLALKNCIVFSQKGDRDLPSMLSGGDLDGDIYNVIWDPEVVPKKQFMAADYPSVKAQPLGREVTKSDMAKFFVDFMKTDQLGIIAMRHLILADKRDEGTLHPDCVKLAEMHSAAVDFSKTGIPVDVSDMPNFKPRLRPDFLSPAPPAELYDLDAAGFLEQPDTKEDEEETAPKFKYYKSEKVLGKLYRNVDEKGIWSSVHKTVPKNTPSIWDQLLGVVDAELVRLGLARVVDWKSKIEAARSIQQSYESNIWDIRSQFGNNHSTPLTELEVLTGSVFNKTGKQTRRQRENSIKMKEKTGDVFTWLVSLLRNGGDPSLESGGDDDTASEVSDMTSRMSALSIRSKNFETRVRSIELCIACLRVGGEKNEGGWGRRRWGVDDEIRSFRVVAGACLLKGLDRYQFDLEEARRREKGSGRGGGYVGTRARR